MIARSRLKTALLAAVSLTAATGATHHGTAADAAPFSQVATAAAVGAPDEERTPVAPAAKTVGFAALAAAALGFAAHLLGGENLRRVGHAVVAVPAAALRAAWSIIRAPARFVFAFAILAAIGLAGIGAFNLEWASGLVIGAALVGVIWAGASRVTSRARGRSGQSPRAVAAISPDSDRSL